MVHGIPQRPSAPRTGAPSPDIGVYGCTCRPGRWKPQWYNVLTSLCTPIHIELVDRVFEAVVKSIENAQSIMAKNKAGLDKTLSNKDSRNKIISKASGVVNALLDPAHQVANLLDGIGGMFPPCKVASNTLAVRSLKCI